MTVKIIAENILSNADFISATDQAGGHIGQPIPDSGNTGAFNLFASGNIADTVYSGTATGDGAADGTTVVDSLLAAYGDDYFIGATIEITSGACSGETATVTDFAQATGTITFAALTAQVVTGVTFTLTIPYATRDFRVELVAGGDPGTATFKWSHDGGTTYLGRDNPNQATWLNPIAHDHDSTYGSAAGEYFGLCITQMANGSLIMIYHDPADGYIKTKTSSDGIVWVAGVRIYDTAGYEDSIIYNIKCLSNGRLLAIGGQSGDYVFASDDNGVTWTKYRAHNDAVIVMYDFVEVNGMLIASASTNDDIYIKLSYDYGASWGSFISVLDDVSGNYRYPVIVKAKDGTIVMVYTTDIDTADEYDMKCIRSTDNGATWGSEINVLTFSTGVSDYFGYPCIVKDLNGDLYCFATNRIGNALNFSVSTDNGATWSAAVEAVSEGYFPRAAIFKERILLTYTTNGSTDYAYIVQRGMFEAYSANGCIIPADYSNILLTNSLSVQFLGGAGITADKWQFEAQYSYGMENIISHSPSKPFRTTTDNFECNIVLDLGQYERFRATGVAFFGCNLRTLSFQMNASDSWGTPSVDESIVFDVGTGTVDAVSGNMVQDTSFLADYPDHHFSSKGKAEKYYLRATAGIDDGVTWGILDNVDGWFILDITTAISIAAADTFAIYQSHVAKTFTGGNYRYIRISIPAQETAEGYYQIGSMIAGQATALDKGWSRGYGKDIEFNIDLLRTPTGGFNPVKMSNRSRVFTLSWPANETARGQLSATAEYLEGKNLVLIPDHTDLQDCYLVKLDGSISQRHRYLNRFDTGLRFIEVL